VCSGTQTNAIANNFIICVTKVLAQRLVTPFHYTRVESERLFVVLFFVLKLQKAALIVPSYQDAILAKG